VTRCSPSSSTRWSQRVNGRVREHPLAILLGLFLVSLFCTSPGALAGGSTDYSTLWYHSPRSSTLNTRDELPSLGGISASAPESSIVTAGWSNITSNGPAPSARDTAGVAYDAADSYVLVFGGSIAGSASSIGDETCTGDTWTFQTGVWTNLSITGPPSNCAPSMAYDAADGFVVETGGFTWNGACHCESEYNQTWSFSAGKWQNLSINSPESDSGAMAYDPAINAVVLCSDEDSREWTFSGGMWSPTINSTGPVYCVGSGEAPHDGLDDLTYDAADGGILGIDLSSSRNRVDTWLFRGGTWLEQQSLPTTGIYGGELAYDPVINYTVGFGNTIPYGGSGYDWQNVTWLFRDDQWSNASISGPKVRQYPALVFDAHDGYILMFGGFRQGPEQGPNASNIGKALVRETWIFTPPPVEIQLGLSASPARICSLSTEDCGLGTAVTRVTLNLTVANASANETSGLDQGSGVVSWGPFYWIDDPILQFVGWENLVPAPGTGLDAKESCAGPQDVAETCSTVPRVTPISGQNVVLQWFWGNPGASNSLSAGDAWTVTFNEVALGPPFGLDPIDTCSTSACGAAGVGPVNGDVAGVGYSPHGDSTVLSLSAPLARVSVLAAPAPTTPVPSSSPPGPPPPIGAPLPVSIPGSPVALPSPVGNAVTSALSSGAGNLSITAAAAGLLSAGVARCAIRSSPYRVGQRVRVGGGRTVPPPSRGSD
jgi:hypothetical protein